LPPSQIRTLRKSLGMSVREFAAALGYSQFNGQVSVYRLENGEREASGSTLMLLKQLAAQARKHPKPTHDPSNVFE
jgi:transcriptional regulator with XRE-family HTH domain